MAGCRGFAEGCEDSVGDCGVFVAGCAGKVGCAGEILGLDEKELISRPGKSDVLISACNN